MSDTVIIKAKCAYYASSLLWRINAMAARGCGEAVNAARNVKSAHAPVARRASSRRANVNKCDAICASSWRRTEAALVDGILESRHVAGATIGGRDVHQAYLSALGLTSVSKEKLVAASRRTAFDGSGRRRSARAATRRGQLWPRPDVWRSRKSRLLTHIAAAHNSIK